MLLLSSCRTMSAEYSVSPASARQEENDEALMLRVAQGDRQAFGVLVERYARKSYAVANRLLFSPPEAEDAAQEAFIKLWVNAPLWNQAKGKFSTWFYRVLTNGCIDRQRRKRAVPLDETMDIADASPGIEQELTERQMAAQVQKAIVSLPERQRVALVLCYYEGLSNKEAAAVMGVHLKALEALLVRARATLRAKLAPLAREVDI